MEINFKNEVKKDLYKSKAMASFSRYENGNIYYNVHVLEKLYIFPISVIEKNDEGEIKLSEDLGTTKFHSGIKGSELIRWILKAIDNETFIESY